MMEYLLKKVIEITKEHVPAIIKNKVVNIAIDILQNVIHPEVEFEVNSDSI